MKILITGGAGYIGSHVVKHLLKETNNEIIVIDNLSTGNIEILDKLKTIRDFEFIKVDLKEFEEIENIFSTNNISTVLHFAASIVVYESIKNPIKYYLNNTNNTTNLIKCAAEHGVKKFIFSSTAAVYGNPINISQKGIAENLETNPINPYGMSKLMSEKIIQDTAQVYKDLKYVIFRYFNVAGADIYYEKENLKPQIGQSFPEATHLIKIASECASLKRDVVNIFGTDFNTYDGTGVRDYIHVDDLADAHIKAIDYLDENPSDIFNVGYGHGYSVKEVLKTMKKVSGVNIKTVNTHRREGDPAILISNTKKLKSKMKWKPKYDNLEIICFSSYIWEKNLYI